MGLFDDLINKGQSLGASGFNVVKSGADLLVDQDSWGRVLTGEGDAGDLLNMALDASILIPGAGLAGGAARLGARGIGRAVTEQAAKEGVEKVAARTALRSPANNAVRDLLGSKVQQAVVTGGGKRAGVAGASKAGTGGAKKAATDVPDTQLRRMASKKEAGVGTRVGFGQSKKRLAANTALTGGANAFQGAYDSGALKSMFGGAGKASEGGSGEAKATTGDAAQPGMLYMVGSDGSQQAVPQAFMDAFAQFMKQNGKARSDQLTYIE